MNKTNLLIIALFALLMLSFLMACDKDNPTGSSGLYPMTWSRVEHDYGGSTGYLTITELFGPQGLLFKTVIIPLI